MKPVKILNAFQYWLQAQVISNKNLKWYRRCVYCMLLLKMLAVWSQLYIFQDNLVVRGITRVLPSNFIFLPAYSYYYNIHWALCCLVLLVGIFYRNNRLTAILAFIVSLTYLTAIDLGANNGDVLLNLFCFVLVFTKEDTKEGSAAQLLTNAAVFVAKVQLCILYFLNFYGKLFVPRWRDGTFMKDVWYLVYFANDYFLPSWFLNPTFLIITSWGVMIFELCFAILVWFRKLRKWVLLAGVLFHLAIALMLSLPDFGITMIIGYILFADFRKRQQPELGGAVI